MRAFKVDELLIPALQVRRRLPRSFMPPDVFMALPEYSLSIPTGVTVGKQWRKNVAQDWTGDHGPPVWVLGEYVESRKGSDGVVIRWHKWGRAMQQFFQVMGGYTALPDEWEVNRLCQERGIHLVDYLYDDAREGGSYALFEREDGLALAVLSAFTCAPDEQYSANSGIYYPSVEAGKKAGPFLAEDMAFGYGTCAVPFDCEGTIDIAKVLDSFVQYRPVFNVVAACKQPMT